MPDTHPTKIATREVSVNVIARDAARVLAHRVKIRQHGREVRLAKDSQLYGDFLGLLTVQIRDRLKGVDSAEVTYDFSIETPPALRVLTHQKHLTGLIWPRGFVLWVTRRNNTVEVVSRTVGDHSQCVHHVVGIRPFPSPNQERSMPLWRRSIRGLSRP